MDPKTCILIGAPVQDGTGRLGCDMGPSAYRAAGIGPALESLGLRVVDQGNLAVGNFDSRVHANTAIRGLPEIAAWTQVLSEAVCEAGRKGLPIVLGGDHSLAAGTLSGHARRAANEGRKLFVLWLDAHPDMHTLETTTSGNLHGVPMAYALGLPGFSGYFPPLYAPLDPSHVCMMGLRSVDLAERRLLGETGIRVHDMRSIDENGVVPLLRDFLSQVERQDGLLHVSLDVDFLDPE
ncbi:MAG TPA: arginase family protein, partial [Rhabdaerophilum sp.]|nr:arginase family protein [Rhabdaerophilum sp.]